MTDVARLSLVADSRDLRTAATDLDRLARQGAETERSVTRSTESITRGFRSLAAALGVTVGVAASIRGISNALSRLDDIAKQARSIDATANGLRAVQLAAGDAGVSAEAATTALQQMTRELARAERGTGPAADALRRLGLSASELARMDADERLAAIADAARDAGLSAGQSADLLRDLGVRSREMALALIDGGDAIRDARQELVRLGLALDATDLAAVEAANDALARMGMVARSFGDTVAVTLAPALQGLAEAFTRAGGEAGVFRAVAERIGFALSQIANVVTLAIDGFQALADQIGGATLAVSGLVAGLVALRAGLLRTGIGALIVGAGELAFRFDKLADSAGGFRVLMGQLGQAATQFFGGLADLATAAAMQLGNVWNRIRADFTAMLAGMADAFSGFLMSLAGAVQSIPVFGAEMADSFMIQAAVMSARATTLAADARRLETAFNNTSAAAQGLAQDGLRRLSTAFDGVGQASQTFGTGLTDGAAAADEMRRALAGDQGGTGGGSGARGGAAGAVDELADAMEELGTQAPAWIDGVATAWADFVVRGFRDFRSFARSIVDTFRNMLRDMIAMAARNRIMIGVGMSGGGVAGAAMAGGAPGGMGMGGMGTSLLGGVLGSFGSSGSILGLGGLGGGVGFLGGLGNSISGGIGGLFSVGANAAAAGGGLAATLGAIAGPLALVAGLFAIFRSRTKELDSGLRVTVDGMGTLVESFRHVERSRLFGLIRSRRFRTEEMEDEAAEPILQAVASIQGGILSAAEALGIGAEAFEGFAHTLEVSTKDLSDSEAQAAIEAAFGEMADALANMAIEGPNAAERLQVMAVSLTAVNDTLRFFGRTLLDVSVASGEAAADLIAMLGGLDNWAAAHSAYLGAFFDDEERLSMALGQLGRDFGALGIALPETRDGFRALVEAQDLTTEAGRELYAGLLRLAPAFAEAAELADRLAEVEARRAEEAAEAELRRMEDLAREAERIAAERYRLETRLLTLMGDTAALRARELALLDPSNRELQERIWALEDEQAAARDAERAATDAARALDEMRRALERLASDALDDLRRAADVERDAANAALDAAVSLAQVQRDSAQARIADTRAAVDREIQMIREASSARLAALAEEIGAQREVTSIARRAADAVRSGVQALRLTTGEFAGPTRAQAQAQLGGLLSQARAGRPVDGEAISRVLGDLRPNTDLFSTQADFIRDAAATLQATRELERLTERQATTEERALERLEQHADATRAEADAQIEALRTQLAAMEEYHVDHMNRILATEDAARMRHRDTLDRLDRQVAAAERELQMAMGTYRATLSMEQALAAVAQVARKIAASELFGGIPGFATGGMHGGGLRIVGEHGPELEATGPSRIIPLSQIGGGDGLTAAEVRQLRQVMEAYLREVARNTHQTTRQLRAWDSDGLPAEREAV